MSTSPKKWILSPAPPDDFIAAHPELPAIILRLLWNRGIRDQIQIDNFLNPDYARDVHDPFLFKQMDKAVDIIFEAIAKDKNIVVHGDYDADGVCAASIIISCLKKLEAKHVHVFIPHREIDGYGLNLKNVESFIAQKTNLIITCDCGVSNFEEVKLAKKNKIKVIITDHHTVPKKLPPADAIIHPLAPNDNYPDKTLCGAGVAFKLVQAMLKKHAATHTTLPDGQLHESFEKWMLDLAAIATIGDMMPLTGESRALTKYGLMILNKTRNVGLKKLLIASGIADEKGNPKRGTYDSSTVGFQIVPRLNAAGRMDHANTAFGLLMSTDDNEAEKLALQLNKNNTERQKITEQCANEARAQIKETNQEKNHVIFVINKNWPIGLLGLISGRLKDEYYKPAIALTETEKEISGSGRSISEFNLIAALQSMPEFFSTFGGHPQACGLSLAKKDNLKEFKIKMEELAAKQTEGVELVPQIDIDADIDLDEVNWKLYDILRKFEPFGVANEEPKFSAAGLTIHSIEPVGADGKHLRILIKHNSHVIRKTIGFGLGDINRCSQNWKECLRPGDKIDMIFTIGVNEWNGNRELQLTIEDIKKSTV